MNKKIQSDNESFISQNLYFAEMALLEIA